MTTTNASTAASHAVEARTWARGATDTELSFAVKSPPHIEANDGERASYAAACEEATSRGLACVRRGTWGLGRSL